jgi:hypothetical protein
MSRSALSLVGGIMNIDGRVYYPERLGREPKKIGSRLAFLSILTS